MCILQLLASRNYITVNKDLIKLIGLEETIILGELASEYNYYFNRNELNDGYFYSTINNIEDNTGLNEYKQRKALKSMQDINIIDIKIKGIPAKRYIKINEEKIIDILNIKYQNNLRTSSLNFKELELENLKGNNNIINKNNKKYNIYGEFENVKLTDEQYEKLKDKNLLSYIEDLSRYLENHPRKKYASHYATILSWSRKDNKNNGSDILDNFDKNNKVEKLTKEEQEELDNILKEIGE